MQQNQADISETQMLELYGVKVCMNLLKDHTTQQNIYWATDSYAYLDKDSSEESSMRFSFYSPITLETITSFVSDEGDLISYVEYLTLKDDEKKTYRPLIRPRAIKSKDEQQQRVKDKAEVFTPSWVCNLQNNLVDEEWFGRSDKLFNSPDPKDPQKWINNEEKIEFPEGKSWKDYVADIRLEITCGEAPYLTNRYDAVSGAYNEIAKYRIGMLDRKLRVVSENTKDSREWVLWAKIALRSIYGYEWQGDNLLLAREALFYTFREHYVERFGETKFNQIKNRVMPGAAYIISWNIWQMDGLKYGLPGYEPYIKSKLEKKTTQLELFSNDNFPVEIKEPEIKPHERLCLIKDFFEGVNFKKKVLTSKDFHDLSAPKITFYSLVNKQ